MDMNSAECVVSDAGKPLISVIIPAYNAEGCIENCIRSVLTQIYKNLEVVVVSDGSTDNTSAVCRKLRGADGRVRIVDQENKGLSGARNAGLAVAKGELMFFLDADDCIDADEIFALYEALVGSGADMAVGGMRYVAPGGEVIRESCAAERQLDELSYWELARDAWACTPRSDGSAGGYAQYVVSCGKLFKREAFRRRCFDEGKVHEDELIIHHLVGACPKIAIVPVCGYCYVQNEGSIMHSESASSYLDAAEAFVERATYFADRSWGDLALWALRMARVAMTDSVNALPPHVKPSLRFERLLSDFRRVYGTVLESNRLELRETTLFSLFLANPSLYCKLRRRRDAL